jgi:hypothetical protein
MTSKGKYILAGVAAATVAVAAAGAIAQRGGHWDGFRGHRGFGHAFGGPGAMGLMGLNFGGPRGRICFGDTGEMTDVMLVRLQHRVDITDDQKATFDEFKAATKAAADKLREGCPKVGWGRGKEAEGDAKAEPPKKLTAVERLAETQAGIEASLEAVKTFRPAAEKFYASLSDEQKAKLDRRGRGGGERHWKKHDRDGDKGDRSPESEPDAPAPDDKG